MLDSLLTPVQRHSMSGLLRAALAVSVSFELLTGSSGQPHRTSGPANSGWAMPRHDPLASAAVAVGPRPPLHVAWQRKLRVDSQLLVVGGRVLFLSNGSAVALDGATGEITWKTRLPGIAEDRAPPLGEAPFGWEREQQLRSPISVQDRVFFAVDTMLDALELRTGEMLWRRKLWDAWPPPDETDGAARRTPPGDEYSRGGFLTQWGGRLLVGTGRDRGRVIALDPKTGTTVWQTPPLERAIPADSRIPLGLSAPIVSSHGTLYFRTERPGRTQQGGRVAWEVDARSGQDLRHSRHSPVAAGPGYLIEQADRGSPLQMASGDRLHVLGSRRTQAARVRCVDASTGWTRWTRTLFRIPARKLFELSPHDTTYAAGVRQLVVGTMVAAYDEYPHPNDAPGGERRVYAYALDPTTGRLLWRRELAGAQPSPSNVVLAGSVVYALDHFGRGGFAAFDATTGRRLLEGQVPDGPYFAFTEGPALTRDALYAADYDQIWAMKGW